MSKRLLGVVDYGIGNHASITACLRAIGFNVAVTDDPKILDSADVLILPGVGAFPPAMKALQEKGLAKYLQTKASELRPVLGICLGMQLLADSSQEFDLCQGLGIIPGHVRPFENSACHIGWNSIESVSGRGFKDFDMGPDFYFNHGFFYECAEKYQVFQTEFQSNFASVIRKDNVMGIQFHPEKSQGAGRAFLKRCIVEIARA